MQLVDERALVANILDYDPTSDSYDGEINKLLNDAYLDLVGSKPWRFAQKTARLIAHADITVTDGTVNNGSDVITTAAAFFADWMMGQNIEIEGVEYGILSVTSATTAYIDSDYAGVSVAGTASFTIKHRNILLPADVDTILDVGHRPLLSTTAVPEGSFLALSRREDDEWNLGLNETGTPDYWVEGDQLFVPSPVTAPASIVNPGIGLPHWPAGTYEFRIAHKYAGVYSALSPAKAHTAPGGDAIEVNLNGNGTGNGSGYRLALFASTPDYKAYRIVLDDIVEAGGGATTLIVAPIVGTGWFNRARHDEAEGVGRRIRLHPRQGSNTEIYIRYLARPFKLTEDTDAPVLPPKEHKLIAHMALVDAFQKHDQPQLAKIYAEKVERDILKLEEHELPKTARRWVKREQFSDVNPAHARARYGALTHT